MHALGEVPAAALVGDVLYVRGIDVARRPVDHLFRVFPELVVIGVRAPRGPVEHAPAVAADALFDARNVALHAAASLAGVAGHSL